MFKRSGEPPRKPEGGLERIAQSNAQRVERSLQAARHMTDAVRLEFGRLWEAPTRSSRVTELRSRVEAVEAAIADGTAILQASEKQPAAERVKSLLAFDARRLSSAMQELEAIVETLRAQPAPPTPPGEITPGGLADKLAKLAAAPPRRGTGLLGRAGGTAPLGPSPLDAKLSAARTAFEESFQRVSLVHAFLGPRLLILKTVFAVTGLPNRKLPWEEAARAFLPAGRQAGIPAGQLLWLAQVAQVCYAEVRAVQRAHMALVQWEEAAARLEEATLLRHSLGTVPPERALALLTDFNLGAFKASVYQLSHLHVAFAGIPHLERLFLPPSR